MKNEIEIIKEDISSFMKELGTGFIFIDIEDKIINNYFFIYLI